MSLKTKLIVFMVIILGATIVVSYVIFARSEAELLQQVAQHVKAVENVGNVLEIGEFWTTNFDRVMRRQPLLRAGQHGRIAQISVLDATTTVIASSLPEDVGLTLAELERRRVEGGKLSVWDRLLKKHVRKYDVTFPIYENGRKQGYLNVVLVMNDLEYLIKKAKYINILWISGMFIGGTIVAALMVHRFTRPIDLLVTASKRVADGDFDTTVTVRSSGELQTLLAGFNEMTEKLREHRALEERYHRSERMAALGELGARLAHEIRNPLNSISLIIDHIRDRFAPDDAKKQQKFEAYVGNIKTELKRLNKLVNDFLQVSRPLKPDMQPIQVTSFVRQIVHFLENEAEKHQVRIESDDAPETLTIMGDEGLLKTACFNIALNAIQAMEDGGTLTIQAALDQQTQSCALSFSDTGPGIPPEHHENIFQPYFTTKKDGTGLGLAIVNRVIEDHQGTIRVRSDAGQGTTMIVQLPLATWTR